MASKLTHQQKSYPVIKTYRIPDCKGYPFVWLFQGVREDKKRIYNYIGENADGKKTPKYEIRMKDREDWELFIRTGQAEEWAGVNKKFKETRGRLVTSEYSMRVANQQDYILQQARQIAYWAEQMGAEAWYQGTNNLKGFTSRNDS